VGPGWRFLEDQGDDPRLRWATVSGLPRTPLERRIRRPALARWRAAAEAVRIACAGGPGPASGAAGGAASKAAGGAASEAAGGTVLVSHLPLMAAATNSLRRVRCPGVPHVAFAFNFTDLPRGARREFLVRALRGIDEFVVFSRFERDLYAERLDLPRERIRFLPWAMEPPRPGPVSPLPESVAGGGYLAAIGGEGRDYALLARVMTNRPQLRLAIVARTYSVAGIDFPPNVTVFTDLPLDQTWRLAADSLGLVIPLRSETTACGHITMVGAQHLGLPLVVTRSRGVADYVADGVTAQVVPAGDGAALGTAIDRLAEGRPAVRAMAAQAQAQAASENALPAWVAYFSDLADRFG